MKTYIKPETEVTVIQFQPMLSNSVTGVSGLDGVTNSDDDFSGGDSDSRGISWGDDDEE